MTSLFSLNSVTEVLKISRLALGSQISRPVITAVCQRGIYAAAYYESEQVQGVVVAVPVDQDVVYLLALYNFITDGIVHNFVLDRHTASNMYKEFRSKSRGRCMEHKELAEHLARNECIPDTSIYLRDKSSYGDLCYMYELSRCKDKVQLKHSIDFPSKKAVSSSGSSIIGQLIGSYAVSYTADSKQLNNALRFIGEAGRENNSYIKANEPFRMYMDDRHLYMFTEMCGEEGIIVFSMVEDASGKIVAMKLSDHEINESVAKAKELYVNEN